MALKSIESHTKLETAAEQYAKVSAQLKELEAQKEELKLTLLTGMVVGQEFVGSDFKLKMNEGRITTSWNDAEDVIESVKKVKSELLRKGILVEKTGLPSLRLSPKK
jgi:acetylornithine/succinyldiaminopimelate/putrescine aminotransferase